MKIIAILVIILFLNFCTYLCHVTEIFSDPSPPCEFPLKCPPLNDTKPQVHPYHNINLYRDLSPVNLFKTDIGNKSLYKIKKELGTGAFGSVFTAIHTPTGDEVALKLFLRNREEQISKEALILQELKDAPNFLQLRDMFKEKDENGNVTIGLIVEYFEADKFKNIYQTLDAYQVKVIIFKTIKTLEYAHSKGIMHRDVKPFNVLMDPETLQVRVIDWGQADYYVPNKSFTPRVSTIAYMAPELLLGYDKYDYSLDVWNTGSMLLEMIFKKFHFFEQNRTKFPVYEHFTKTEQEMVLRRAQLDQYAQVFGTEELKNYAIKFKYDMEYVKLLRWVGRYEGVPLTNFITEANADMMDPLVLDLLSKMLVYDHTKRITMAEALKHPYFDEVREKYGSE